MPEKKTMIWAAVAVVAVAAVGGVTYAVVKNKKPQAMLAKAARAMGIAAGPRAVGIDYDATASMWEDEDRIYKAASKLDGGY